MKRFLFGTLLILGSVWVVSAQYAVAGASPVLTFGDPKAPNRIEAYYDFQCGECVRFHESVKRLMARYPDTVFVIFRHFPVSTHNQAFMTSSVVEAAKRQGKGIEMIGLLLDEQSRWSTSPQPFQIILELADRLKLDIPRFRSDVTSNDVIRSVVLDMNRGKRLGVVATPTVFLNGRLLSASETAELEQTISKGN